MENEEWEIEMEIENGKFIFLYILSLQCRFNIFSVDYRYLHFLSKTCRGKIKEQNKLMIMKEVIQDT